MSRQYCAIIPQVRNQKGESVDSKLFTDLLSFTKDRRKATKLYVALKNSEKNTYMLDDNGEPTFESFITGLRDDRSNPINKYASSKNITPEEIKFLKIHKEIVNEISREKTKIRGLKKEKSKIIAELQKQGLYSPQYAPVKEITEKIEAIEENIAKLKDKLPDLSGIDVRQAAPTYVELAHILMDKIESKVSYDLNNPEDITLLSQNYRYLSSFDITDDPTIVARAKELMDGLMDDVGEYVKALTPYLNLEGADFKELTMDKLKEESKDVNWAEYIFNGFGDYPRLEAQLIHSRVLKGKSAATTRTIQATNKLLSSMKVLDEWAKKNIKGFGKLQKAYNMLLAIDNRGRLSLVKPYSRQYYRDMATAFKNRASDDKDVRDSGKNWLATFYNKPATGPYVNPDYVRIQSTPELKQFYDFFKQTVKEQYELLPPWLENKNDEKLPSLMKEATFNFLDVIRDAKDNGVRHALWSGIKTLLFGEGTIEMYDEHGGILSKAKHVELSQDEIRLRMLREMSADRKSRDLGAVLQKFISFTNEYAEMEKVLPEVRLIESIVAGKTYENQDKRFLGGKGSNMHAAIRRYIDAKVVGNDSKKFGRLSPVSDFVTDNDGNIIGERAYYFSDFVKQTLSYTRSLYLGLNIFSGLNNVTMGLIGDLVEASGGEYFSKRDLAKAIKIYWGTRFTKESKFNKLVEYIQPLQELGEYEEQDKAKIQPNLVSKVWSKRFILQEKGEDFVQSIPMIAYLLNKKVTLVDGTKKSVWELYDVKNGELVFDKDSAGFEPDGNMINRWREDIKYVNRQIHGNYSTDNASVFSPYVLFQAAILFRKWIPQAVQQRFQARRYNYITGKESEGRFVTLFNVLVRDAGFYKYPLMFIRDLMGMERRFSDPAPLEPFEKANMRKCLTEALVFLATTLTMKIVAPPPEEDELTWHMPEWYRTMSLFEDKQEYNQWRGPAAGFYKSMLDQVRRAQTDVANLYTYDFYSSIIEDYILLKMSVSVGKMFHTLFLEVSTGNFDGKKSYYKRGPAKGERKDINQVLNLIPVVKQANKFRTASAAQIDQYQQK